MKKETKTIIVLSLILLGFIGFYIINNNEPSLILGEDITLKAPQEKILDSREIDWIETKDFTTINRGELDRYSDNGKIIKYAYISDVEVSVESGEDITKRTSNTKFFNKGDHWEAKIYPGNPFIQQEDKWYQVETATSSIDNFLWGTRTSWFERLLGKSAYAACGDSGGICYAGTKDGGIYISGAASWTLARDTADGATVEDAAETYVDGEKSGAVYHCYRLFFPFDTSALPTGAVVTEAIISLYYNGVGDASNGGGTVVVTATVPSDQDLVVGDYDDNVGGDAVSNVITLSTLTTGGAAYYNYTLDSAGESHIADDGWSNFSLQTTHDRTNTTPEARGYAQFRMSNYTGTANDPYITITYTEAPPVTPDDAGSMDVIWFD